MTDAERLGHAIIDYCHQNNIPVAEPSDLYNLQEGYTQSKEFPNNKRSGCYVFYDAQHRLLYVDKVSTLGDRIASYFRWNIDRTAITPKDVGWTTTPSYVQAIPVRDPFEASSLEEYLIGKLQPCDNTMGIRQSPE